MVENLLVAQRMVRPATACCKSLPKLSPLSEQALDHLPLAAGGGSGNCRFGIAAWRQDGLDQQAGSLGRHLADSSAQTQTDTDLNPAGAHALSSIVRYRTTRSG